MIFILLLGYGPGYSDYSRYNNYDSHFSRDSYYPNYRYWYRGYNIGCPTKHEDLEMT